MGDGADYMDEAPQGGGEYFGGGFAAPAPAPGPWGPPEQVYDPRYVNMQPAPAYPQRPQPAPEYRPAPPMQRQPRRRKASKGMQRMYLVQYYEAVLETPLFGDPNDPYAHQVQEEIVVFAQRRIDELLGEAPERGGADGFTTQETQALKVLAQRMLEVEEAPTEAIPAPPTPRLPQPVQAPAEPPALTREPVQAAAEPRPEPPEFMPPRQTGPRVIARPTPAQRQALEQARQNERRPVAPPQPVAQIVQHPLMARPVPAPQAQPPTPKGKRGRRAQIVEQLPTPGPPPPMRFAMPQGEGMTAISAMQASKQIESGGTVLSQTFVRSAGK